MLEYKVEYAAWLAASKAWNVTRAEQVATHIAERVVYAKALASDHVARVAIVAARTTALADARQTYLDAAATSTNPALRAKWLSVRTAAYAAIIASAEVQLAALPVLGPKPVWPVAAPRPVKPLKQVITLEQRRPLDPWRCPPGVFYHQMDILGVGWVPLPFTIFHLWGSDILRSRPSGSCVLKNSAR